MAEYTVKIKNLNEIKRAFNKAPALTVKALNKAIQRSIFQVERDSKQNTPVRTGYLRSSHITNFTDLRGELIPEADYAIYVHEGTRFLRPRPFLMDALNTNERMVQDEFKDAVQSVLDDIGRSV